MKLTLGKNKRTIFAVVLSVGVLAFLGFAAAQVLADPPPEPAAPVKVEAPERTHVWTFVPTVLPPSRENGSAVITLNTVNSHGDEFARDPEGIQVAFLFLAW